MFQPVLPFLRTRRRQVCDIASEREWSWTGWERGKFPLGKQEDLEYYIQPGDSKDEIGEIDPEHGGK